MDLSNFTVLAAALVGLNQLIRLARAKDWWGVTTVVSAVLLGLIFGLLHVQGLTWETGLLVALASVGTLTGISMLGSGNAVTPNSKVVKE